MERNAEIALRSVATGSPIPQKNYSRTKSCVGRDAKKYSSRLIDALPVLAQCQHMQIRTSLPWTLSPIALEEGPPMSPIKAVTS
jgi:hypothetical protein